MMTPDHLVAVRSPFLATAVVQVTNIFPDTKLSQNRQVDFLFPDVPKVHEVIGSFSDGTLSLPILVFTNIYRRVRGEMMNCMNHGGVR